MVEVPHRAPGTDHGARAVVGDGGQVAVALMAGPVHQVARDQVHRRAGRDAAAAHRADDGVLQLVPPRAEVAPVDAALREEPQQAERPGALGVAATVLRGHGVEDLWPVRTREQLVSRGDRVAAAAGGHAGDGAQLDDRRQIAGFDAGEEVQKNECHGSSE